MERREAMKQAKFIIFHCRESEILFKLDELGTKMLAYFLAL